MPHQRSFESFYDDLRAAIRNVSAHNFLAILGYFNARLGPEDAPFTYHETNRNRKLLAELYGLLAANKQFQKNQGKGKHLRTDVQR